MQTNETTETATNTKNENLSKSNPPPIYIYGVTNYREMVEHIATTAEEEQYYCKALSNETIKINVTTPESYRKLIKQLQQEKIAQHTYQIREEKAYKIVIRNPHHSVATDEIKEEIEKQWHAVPNILNFRHRLTKEPLPLFFIDLEPKENNKSIYEIKYLCNMKLKPQERKTTLYSAQDVSATDTQKHIAQDLMLVSNVKVNITQLNVERIQTLQQNAPYEEEITRLAIKAATYIKTYESQQTK
jgi:hypothetical protein